MRINTTTLVLGVALTVVAGLFSSTIFGLVGTKDDYNTTPGASGLITGHVTATVRDAAGNIKEYRQTDNLILNTGENCAAKMLFGGGNKTGTTVCTGINSGGYQFIEIGNGTSAANGVNDVLGSGHNATGLAPSSMRIKLGTMNWITNSSSSNAQTETRIAATFTNNGGTSQTVSEAGLFNGTSHATNSMFARQTFSTITLNNNDQLTVEWRMSIGGTTTFN